MVKNLSVVFRTRFHPQQPFFLISFMSQREKTGLLIILITEF